MGFPEHQMGQWDDAREKNILVWGWSDWLARLEGGIGDGRWADGSSEANLTETLTS